MITGESSLDEKMLKKCSTDQRFIQKRNTTYEIGTVALFFFKYGIFSNISLFFCAAMATGVRFGANASYLASTSMDRTLKLYGL